MEGIYDIFLWDKPVGKAEVAREGLYYRFICRCCVTEDTLCRVAVGRENLGVLVPAADGFVLETKLPVKRFVNTVPEFRLIPNRPILEGRFVPIKPEEPFAYISRLKTAYLCSQDGQVGAIIKETAGT